MTNEEKFETPEERKGAFNRYCSRKECSDCKARKIPHDPDGRIGCLVRWLALEAEEEKPLACPLCGGEAVAVQPWLTGGASVICEKCGTFIWAPTQAEAISVWNRSAK